MLAMEEEDEESIIVDDDDGMLRWNPAQKRCIGVAIGVLGSGLAKPHRERVANSPVLLIFKNECILFPCLARATPLQ